MIIAKCPVRISLAGGSTDLDEFLKRHKVGKVISFSANIYNYIAVKTDKLGLNGLDKKYVVNYMKKEVVDDISEIQNDIAKTVFKYFNVKPTTIWFTSDIYTSGSGLASSTSYLISAIKAIQEMCDIEMSNFNICNLAYHLEKKFNPLAGYQDSFGCGMGGFNKFIFKESGETQVERLPQDFFTYYDVYLLNTGLIRSSTDVLKTIDPDKCLYLLEIVEKMHKAILQENYSTVLELVREGWEQKKKTSTLILENENLKFIDSQLSNNKNVLAHRLLGAGNGGYFLSFVKKDESIEDLQLQINKKLIKINVCQTGAVTSKL